MPLKIGDLAPDFTLSADDGTTVTLSALRGKKVVVYFYPKDDTPGCTTQACGFRDNYDGVLALNAIVLGISPDNVKSHQKFKQKQNLPFPLLADEDHAVADAYGAWGERSLYGHKFQGIIRSHYVIDANGRIADIHIKIAPKDSVKLAIEKLSE